MDLEEINESPDSHFYRGVNSDGDHLFVDEDAITAGHDPQTCMRIIPAGVTVGDRIWVKETHWRYGKWVADMDKQTSRGLPTWRFKPIKCADEFRFTPQTKFHREQEGYHKRPSIFMPREAARIILEVTEPERCERVQEISEADAKSEGVFGPPQSGAGYRQYPYECCSLATARDSFRSLWGSLHGPGAWQRNDWVRVIHFRRTER